MNINASLMILAQLFSQKSKLYLVGGKVRNAILGVETEDCDICSALNVEEVEKLLIGSQFYIKSSYKRLGSLLIASNYDSHEYEYTAFRRDTYSLDRGIHIPIKVEFIDNIEIDAQRRDFRMNAIYYDILNDSYVDPLNAMADLIREPAVVSTTREPNEIFREDPVRILRIFRQAAQIGFDIDENTIKGIERNVKLLENISGDRKRKELNLLLSADEKYYKRSNSKHITKMLRLMNKTGVFRYIMPLIEEQTDLDILQGNAKMNMFENTLSIVENVPSFLRLSALCINLGRCESLLARGNIKGSEIAAEAIIYNVLGIEGLNYSIKEIKKVANIVKSEAFNNYGPEAKSKTIRKFIVSNALVIDDVVEIKKAILKAFEGHDISEYEKRLNKLLLVYENMRKDEMPLSVKDLLIDGDDIEQMGARDKTIGNILNEVLMMAVNSNQLKTRSKQLEYAQKLFKNRTEDEKCQ